MRQLRLSVLHSARQNVRNGALSVEFQTQLLVDTSESAVRLLGPYLFEVLETLQFERTHPIEEFF